MSRGKYSPCLPNLDEKSFVFNSLGEEPAVWDIVVSDAGVEYNVKTMFDNFDSDGYDRYGYSCYDTNGGWVGIGSGIDRLGYTEMDYLNMTEKEYTEALSELFRSGVQFQ